MHSPSYQRHAERLVVVLWVAAVGVATLQQGIGHQNNNFLIFRAASLHLLEGRDLYAAYPAIHFDFYKYTPAVAFLFLPFALLPFTVALLAWNALNAGVLWLAIGMVLPPRSATVARAVVFLDMLGSLQNVQSNALVTGLIITTFAAYERERTMLGGLAASVAGAIKVFPLAAVSFSIFHGQRVRLALVATAVFSVLLLLPLLVTPAATLQAQYASWSAIQATDTLRRGFTVMEMAQLLFRRNWSNIPFQIAGTMLLVAPVLLRSDRWKEWEFRLHYLSSVLIFSVIFNHRSESPSFVIAVTGFAIWFASLPRRTGAQWALSAFFALFTILASSDVMPDAIQRDLFDAYSLKVIPCIVTWVVLQRSLWRPGSASISSGPGRGR